MFKEKTSLFLKVIIFFIFFLTSNCAVNNKNTYDANVTYEANDPWENLNRGTHEFNIFFDKYMLAPLAKGYRVIFPDQIRYGIRNFFRNLSEPWTSINSILQGDFKNTGTSLGRFLINSTVGLLGFIDVASEIGLEKQKEDFGQTMAVHGVGPGPYLVLPFLGPSTLRDAMGKVVSFVGDPVTLYLDRNDKNEWIWVGTAIKGVDFREQNLEKIDNLKATSIDFYATLRSLYLERRTRMITNQNPSEQDPFLEFDIE